MATVNSKHKAVWDWLQKCTHISDLFFNLGLAIEGSTTLVPSEQLAQEFADGSAEYYYDCALTRWFTGSFDANDVSNINKLIDFDKVADWVDKCNRTGDLPVFPTGYTVNNVTIQPNMSGFIAIQDEEIAKFLLQFRIEYLRSRKDV